MKNEQSNIDKYYLICDSAAEAAICSNTCSKNDLTVKINVDEQNSSVTFLFSNSEIKKSDRCVFFDGDNWECTGGDILWKSRNRIIETQINYKISPCPFLLIGCYK